MEDLYGFQTSCADYAVSMDVQQPAAEQEGMVAVPADYSSCFGSASFPMLVSSEHSSLFSGSSVSDAASLVAEMQQRSSEQEASSVTRAKIASHPLYPRLLEAYIECQKVGAPPDMAYVLDGIRHEFDLSKKSTVAATTCLGADPELDEFMETYCQILAKYKLDLSRPFHEATAFLNDIEAQFNTICSSGASIAHVSGEAAGSSDEDASGGEVELRDRHYANGDREIKDKLLRKYSGCISSLKHEFLKNKKKKGKLPKEARQVLLNWWSIHSKWPYPTEVDKVSLANATGLDQKQINNWFINQRKRHWKPSENTQFAVMDSLYGSFFMNDD